MLIHFEDADLAAIRAAAGLSLPIAFYGPLGKGDSYRRSPYAAERYIRAPSFRQYQYHTCLAVIHAAFIFASCFTHGARRVGIYCADII